MKKLLASITFLGLLFSAAPALAQAPGAARESGSVVQSIFNSLEHSRETRQERARQNQQESQATQQDNSPLSGPQVKTADKEAATSTAAASTTPAASTRPGTPAAQSAAAISALGEQNGTPQPGVYEAGNLTAMQMQILLTAALAMGVAGFLLVERRTLERLLATGPARRAHSLRV